MDTPSNHISAQGEATTKLEDTVQGRGEGSSARRRCPCCGQTVNFQDEYRAELLKEIKLTPGERIILMALNNRFGEWMTLDELTETRYSFAKPPTQPRQTVKMLLSNIRGALAGSPFELESAYKLGYRLLWKD